MDSYFPELGLFLTSPVLFGAKPWQARCRKWLTHVNLFASLKAEPRSKQWNEARIIFLTSHLNVLDTKFSVLLTVNTLLLIAVNGLINSPLILKPLQPGVTMLVSVFWGLWLITSILCLIGERRIVWGDLGLIGSRRLVCDDGETPTIWDEHLGKSVEPDSGESKKVFEDAVEAHVRDLVVAVAKRTNKFRMTMLSTYLNVGVAAWIFFDGFLEIASSR